jgi:hypothetical protein
MTAMTKGCLAGQAVCFVSHEGEVFPCGYLPVSSGNVNELGLPKIWRDSQVFADLRSFKADGGGDGPESVNQALDDAVNKVSWTKDDASGDGGGGGGAGGSTSKFIFLVGDYPPHMDYADDAKFPQTCESAVRKNLIINTVQCGSNTETADVWRDIARRGEGAYVSLA